MFHVAVPYTHVYQATNLAEVHRKLAEADEEEIARGIISYPVPAWVFVRDGLDLEEQQLVLSYICTSTGNLLRCLLQATARIRH